MARGICPGGQRLGGWGGRSRWRGDWSDGSGGRQAPSRGLLPRSAGTRVGGGGAAEPSRPRTTTLHSRSRQKRLPLPCLSFPSISVGTCWPVSPEATDPYVKALWKLKRRAPPREWLLLMQRGAGERGFARFGALSLGKEVTLRRRRTAVAHIVGGASE